jgi:hypothetical protein
MRIQIMVGLLGMTSLLIGLKTVAPNTAATLAAGRANGPANSGVQLERPSSQAREMHGRLINTTFVNSYIDSRDAEKMPTDGGAVQPDKISAYDLRNTW